GFDYSWFILTQRIIKREFALSGSEQNPDLTNKDIRLLFQRVVSKSGPAPVEAFKQKGADFVVAASLGDLVRGMNALTDEPRLDPITVEREIAARDREVDKRMTQDAQILAIRSARRYLGDRLIRVATPHRLLDPAAGPLIAVRLRILTRKTLGGLQTDLSGRVLRADGTPLPGLYAAGEVAGFGGGGMHGYRSLAGTFLGGCLFCGWVTGRAVPAIVSSTMSPLVIEVFSPSWVKRSLAISVPVVSSNARIASQQWGTCGVIRNRSLCRPRSSTSPSPMVLAGRIAKSLTLIRTPSSLWTGSACGASWRNSLSAPD